MGQLSFKKIIKKLLSIYIQTLETNQTVYIRKTPQCLYYYNSGTSCLHLSVAGILRIPPQLPLARHDIALAVSACDTFATITHLTTLLLSVLHLQVSFSNCSQNTAPCHSFPLCHISITVVVVVITVVIVVLAHLTGAGADYISQFLEIRAG